MKRETYNYRLLFRHSYTLRGRTSSKFGGITYAVSLENFVVVLLAFLVNLPFVYFVWKTMPNFVLASVIFPPFIVYKIHDMVNPDGLKVHQYVWQYLKYMWQFYLPDKTICHDVQVFYTEDEVQIK